MTAMIPDSATPLEMPASTRRKVTDIFTREEIKMLTERSDLMGFAAVGFTWGVIILTFAALAWASAQPLSIAIPVFVLGFIVMAGRHLGLAILHHEAAHKTLFKNPGLNDFIGDWFCARPIWNDVKKYRVHHFMHHTKTGQEGDTDLSLVAPFPTSQASLMRKFARDLVGLTGLKYLLGRVLMDAGVLKWTVASDIVKLPQEGRRWWEYPRDLLKNSAGMLLTNGMLLAALWASGYPWLYAVWVLSYVTPFPLFLRIRSLAEHACTEKTTDMFLNTRSTRAGFIARATVAPIRVNYHIEHHVMASVPYFRLPLMHRMLRERGAVSAPPGYLDVLRIVSSKPAA
ncbi:MAG: fatty acid desaturase family protein [Moraxellaceae bacterium]